MGTGDKTVLQKTLGKRAEKLARRAHWHLLWETYAPVLALGILFLIVFLIGASSGFWQRIGDPWRLIALFVALFFLTRSFLHARKVRKPTRSQALRRVERDSGLSHRPMDTLTDTAALGREDILAWRTHVQRAKSKIANAAPSQLRAVIAPIDKYFLRFVAPCALVLAMMVGAGDNWERIRASINPTWQAGISAKNARYEAWVDPPEYTGRPPSYFKGETKLVAPEGSEFVARISGVKTPPRLIVREGNRTRRISLMRLGPKSFEGRAIVQDNVHASFRIGNESQIWKLDVQQDRHPKVKFDTPPEAGKRDKLQFTYDLDDDFGVETLSLVMELVDSPDNKDVIDVPLPGSSLRSLEKEPGSLDLTKHKWAGKKVKGYLSAVDGKNQIGNSEFAEFIVPDKIFVEPLAKAVVEQRGLMLAGKTEYKPVPGGKSTDVSSEDKPMFAVDRPEMTIERAPVEVQRTALLIEAATDKPVGIFEDPTVYMGLRNVYRRIETARSQNDLSGIPEDLWAIALRAEFGVLGDALADMQAAERALNNAMARRAPQREIDALFERYNNAVDRYMEELTKKAIEEAKKNAGDQNGMDGDGADFNTDEIQELLDAIEEANRLGDTVAARKALAKLAQLLENMEIQMAQGGGGSGDGLSDGMSEELQEALEDLNDLLGEQRQLRDETQDAGREQLDEQNSQNNGQPESGQNREAGKSGQQLAEEQQALSELLEKLEESAAQGLADENGNAEGGPTENGEDGDGSAIEDDDGKEGGGGSNQEKIDEALRDARRGMQQSEDALEDSDFYAAGRAQSDAIDALRTLGEELYAEEARRLSEQDGENEQGGDQAGGDADPFGRENDGAGDDDSVKVPEIDDRQRARDLLEKLRRRSGEQDRDKTERDYIDRLLERF